MAADARLGAASSFAGAAGLGVPALLHRRKPGGGRARSAEQRSSGSLPFLLLFRTFRSSGAAPWAEVQRRLLGVSEAAQSQKPEAQRSPAEPSPRASEGELGTIKSCSFQNILSEAEVCRRRGRCWSGTRVGSLAELSQPFGIRWTWAFDGSLFELMAEL